MFTLPALPYDFSALEPFIDTQTMQIHHDKHHQSYVDNLNKALEGHDEFLKMDIEELVTHLDRVPEDVRLKVKNNGGGHFNHSLFWTLMSPPPAGGPKSEPRMPSGPLFDAIKASFTNFDGFKEKFANAVMERFGSGWAWLIIDAGKLAITDTANQDNPAMEGKKIVLGLDVWEHAYYLKYQNKRLDYVNAWWNVVNWEAVGDLYNKYNKQSLQSSPDGDRNAGLKSNETSKPNEANKKPG